MVKSAVVFKPINAKVSQKSLNYVSNPEYNLTFTEWLVRNGQMIATSSDPIGTGIITHYTVPVGYNFYLSNVAMWGIIVNPSVVLAFISTSLTANGTTSTLGQITGHSGPTPNDISYGTNFVENFNPPIRMKAGDSIYYNAAYWDIGGLSTFGYLLPISKDVK